MKPGLLALILLLPTFAAAKHETGNDLLGNCSLALKLFNNEKVSGQEDLVKSGDCTGIVGGVMQTAPLFNARFSVRPDNRQLNDSVRDSCAAPDVSVEQVVRMVVQRLKSHPDELQLDAAVIVLRVMNDFSAATCVGGSGKQPEGLQWPDLPRKTPMRLRLVALALADQPRSSFFSSREVFVAEGDSRDEEWSFIKLVFTFLPYQPRLSESGFDYSVVHEVEVWRNPDCDETVSQLTARSLPARHEPLVYSRNVPRVDLDNRRIPLLCYETRAADYIRSSLEPIPQSPKTPARPVLQVRQDPR